MFRVKCKCGDSEMNFKADIGPFYITECCEKAGYDEKGERDGEEQGGDLEIQAPTSPFDSTPVLEGDLDKDGDVDKDDVQLSSDLEKMSQKELQALCDERKIEYAKNESKVKLREKLK